MKSRTFEINVQEPTSIEQDVSSNNNNNNEKPSFECKRSDKIQNLVNQLHNCCTKCPPRHHRNPSIMQILKQKESQRQQQSNTKDQSDHKEKLPSNQEFDQQQQEQSQEQSEQQQQQQQQQEKSQQEKEVSQEIGEHQTPTSDSTNSNDWSDSESDSEASDLSMWSDDEENQQQQQQQQSHIPGEIRLKELEKRQEKSDAIIEELSTSGFGNIWKRFIASKDIDEVLSCFEKIKEESGVSKDGEHIKTEEEKEDNQQKKKIQANLIAYEKIKELAKKEVTNSKRLWDTLDRKIRKGGYKVETPRQHRRMQSRVRTDVTEIIERLPACKDNRVAVIGAGPAGLRFAIESRLLGLNTLVIEKRNTFSRLNLLHVWCSSYADLCRLGAKYFIPGFCSGPIHHIATHKLQLFLLKVALLFGVHFVSGVEFRGVDQSDWSLQTEPPLSVFFKPSTDAPLLSPSVSVCSSWLNSEGTKLLSPDVIVGADGENSIVAQFFTFEQKLFQGSQAIGITSNFINNKTEKEMQNDEFGLMAVYNQDLFKTLKDEKDIDLENLVYYREDTHYFVMTIRKESLIKRGVLATSENQESNQDLLRGYNKEKLDDLVRDVAQFIGLPTDLPFAKTSSGENDTQIFDFSKKRVCQDPTKVITLSNGSKKLVCIVGDALLEPFWPQGTGLNRAILADMDAVWNISLFFKLLKNNQDPETQLKSEVSTHFKKLMAASEGDICTNFENFTINPKSRYKVLAGLL